MVAASSTSGPMLSATAEVADISVPVIEGGQLRATPPQHRQPHPVRFRASTPSQEPSATPHPTKSRRAHIDDDICDHGTRQPLDGAPLRVDDEDRQLGLPVAEPRGRLEVVADDDFDDQRPFRPVDDDVRARSLDNGSLRRDARRWNGRCSTRPPLRSLGKRTRRNIRRLGSAPR